MNALHYCVMAESNTLSSVLFIRARRDIGIVTNSDASVIHTLTRNEILRYFRITRTL